MYQYCEIITLPWLNFRHNKIYPTLDHIRTIIAILIKCFTHSTIRAILTIMRCIYSVISSNYNLTVWARFTCEKLKIFFIPPTAPLSQPGLKNVVFSRFCGSLAIFRQPQLLFYLPVLQIWKKKYITSRLAPPQFRIPSRVPHINFVPLKIFRFLLRERFFSSKVSGFITRQRQWIPVQAKVIKRYLDLRREQADFCN